MILCDLIELENEILECNNLDDVIEIVKKTKSKSVKLDSVEVLVTTSRLMEKVALDKPDELTNKLLKFFYYDAYKILKGNEII